MSRLHHVALGARDVEKVASFYRTVFELPEVSRHRAEDGSLRSIWLHMGPTLLMIERADAPSLPPTAARTGPFLLAFRVDKQDRAELERRLVNASAVIEQRTAYSSYARDPEGNRVAVSHYPDPA